MSEQINMKTLLKALDNAFHTDCVRKEDVINLIINLRAADVVEVVRCRDCKYFCQFSNIEHTDGSCLVKMLYSDSAQYSACQFNDYCSYGERRSNNE